MKRILLCLFVLSSILIIGIMTMPAIQVTAAPPNQEQPNYFDLQAIVAPMDIGMSPGQRLYASRTNLDNITQTAVTTGAEMYGTNGRFSRLAAQSV
jgi:hypothetical protein